LADIYNKYYNPSGKCESCDFQFSYEDESFDFVFLTSVFTHMLPPDMENYFAEIARVLKPGGRCLITFFLLNEESLRLVDAKESTLDFQYRGEGYRTINPRAPEEGLGYDESYILSLYKKNGLAIEEPIHYGNWCQRKSFLSFQDIIVATKVAKTRQPPSNGSVRHARPQTSNGDLIRTISPNDEMFGANKSEVHYFSVGRSALECIQTSLRAAEKAPANVKRILDLPCGHGRVLRHLRAGFPGAVITACDLLRDGADYCAATFGAVPVYAHEDPARIPLAHSAFDLIWVGSLFTRFDADRWPAFLNFFRDCLAPGGVLVFSAHGRTAYKWMIEKRHDYGLLDWYRYRILHDFEKGDFGYANYLIPDRCGVSLAGPAWVLKQLTKIRGLRVVHFAEGAWDTHHDVYGCIRETDWWV
jgi:SAM-dependent methyltransferase